MKKNIFYLLTLFLLVGITTARSQVWAPLSGGTNGFVNCMVQYGSDLYVGGCFIMADGQSADAIAKWNGSTWSTIPGFTQTCVKALAVYNGELYATGTFDFAGNVSV